MYRGVMLDKVKIAAIILQRDKVIFECPHCGRILIRSNYEKAGKLLDETGAPRGKICAKCGGMVMLKLDAKSKKLILSRSAPVPRTK